MTEKKDQERGLPVDAFGGATVDPTKNVLDLVEAANRRQDDQRDALDRRLTGETVALKDWLNQLQIANDKRYEQRFDASQKALEAAFAAQKDAVNAAFAAQKEAINAALAAQDRAVSKAETSAEKRFEGVNEFRAQLGDQQRTLMPRSEVDVLMRGINEKINQNSAAANDKITQLTKQLDGMISERRGGQAMWAFVVAGVMTLVALVSLAIRFQGL